MEVEEETMPLMAEDSKQKSYSLEGTGNDMRKVVRTTRFLFLWPDEQISSALATTIPATTTILPEGEGIGESFGTWDK